MVAEACVDDVLLSWHRYIKFKHCKSLGNPNPAASLLLDFRAGGGIVKHRHTAHHKDSRGREAGKWRHVLEWYPAAITFT